MVQSETDRLAELEAVNAALRSLVHLLAVRCAAQSELLAHAASSARPVAGAEAVMLMALQPFAQVFAGDWDSGELSADALYPVRMGDLRRAARAVAHAMHTKDLAKEGDHHKLSTTGR